MALSVSNKSCKKHNSHLCLIYPLTARLVGAPQMILQLVSSIFPCSPLPSGTWWTPGLSILWFCLPTSSPVCLVFFPLSLCLARWFLQDPMNGTCPYHCSLCLFMLVRSSCGLTAWWILAQTSSLVTWSLYEMHSLAVAPHFHGLYSSLKLYCEDPWFRSIQEDGCDKRVHQLCLGTERNTPVIPNWFQPSQCCCCLCYPGDYLRLGTLVSYNWVQVLEVCNCLKLVTVSSFCPFTLISVLMSLVLFVISLVFSALISICQ